MHAMSDTSAGWSSFIRNSLTAHAKTYPEIWYGIWTGPDSYNGPAHERPGEADAHAVTALTDYPALNAHVHTSPLRALRGLLGVSGTPTGMRIDPRVPTETFSVVWPRLTLDSRPDSMSGSVTASATQLIEMRVTLPSGLRQGELIVTAASTPVPYLREADALVFVLPVQNDEPVSWSIARASQ
jgi:hypothetical protein